MNIITNEMRDTHVHFLRSEMFATKVLEPNAIIGNCPMDQETAFRGPHAGAKVLLKIESCSSISITTQQVLQSRRQHRSDVAHENSNRLPVRLARGSLPTPSAEKNACGYWFSVHGRKSHIHEPHIFSAEIMSEVGMKANRPTRNEQAEYS
jgi:hypothetical protein